MKRVGLVVAYDGTNYSGWQIQPNGITIEEMAENLTHAAFYSGLPKAWAALRMAKEIYQD